MKTLAMILTLTIAASGQAASLDLGDLIGLAEKGNFTMIEGRLNNESSRAGFSVARSAILPRLGIDSSTSYSSRTDSGGERWASSAALVLSQNFYDGGQSWSALEQSRVTREQAALSEQRARETMSIEVVRAYATSSRLARNRVAASRKLKLLEEQFDLVRRQFRQGRKTQRDYQLLEAELERSRLELESVENEIFESFRNLEKVVGSPATPLDPTTVQLLTIDQIMALKDWYSKSALNAEEESLDLKIQKLGVRSSEIALQQARREYWPRLYLNGTASYGSRDFVGPGAVGWTQNDGTNLGVSLQLNWTLFDWGGVPAQVSQAKSRSLLEEKRFEQRKLEVISESRVLENNVQRQTRILEVQKKIRDLERVSFREIEREYREGRSEYLDLISALERDIRAEQSFENEVFSYFVSLAELLELKGKLYDRAKSL